MIIPKREQRHDIDWVRIIVLVLMIAYHGLVFFQPWAGKLLFLQNKESLEILWRFPAEMINVSHPDPICPLGYGSLFQCLIEMDIN